MPLNWALNVRSEEELERRGREVYGETQDKVAVLLLHYATYVAACPVLLSVSASCCPAACPPVLPPALLCQVEQALEDLAAWARKSPHLRNIRHDPQVLIRFSMRG